MKLATNLTISICALLLFLFGMEVVVHGLSSNTFQSRFPQNPITGAFKACQIKNPGSSLSPSFYELTDTPPGLWYELKPGATGTLYNTPVSINSFGMRNREVTLEKPAGTFRIAVISDSATFGYRVNVEDRYSSLLEEKLKKTIHSKEVEVLNFAVPGYNTGQEILILESKVLKFKPDLIIFGHSLNDIYGQGTVSLETSATTKYLMGHSALFNCFDFSKLAGIKRIFVTDYTLNGPFNEMYAEHSATWETYKKSFGEVEEIVHKAHVPTLFVLLPIFRNLNETYEYTAIDAKLKETIESAGMFALDMSPATGITYDEASTYLVDQEDFDHPNRKGHNVIAEAILKKLLQDRLIPY